MTPENKFPGITYPTTRAIIAHELNISAKTLRKMLESIGAEKGEYLSPKLIDLFREKYIDGG